MCGAEGFVDSTRNQHSYRVRSQGKSKSKDGPAQSGDKKMFTVVDLAAIKGRDQKEHDKRLKVIEVGYRWMTYQICPISGIGEKSIIHLSVFAPK